MVSFIFHIHTLPFYRNLVSSSPLPAGRRSWLTSCPRRAWAFRPPVSLGFMTLWLTAFLLGLSLPSAAKEVAACLFRSNWSGSLLGPVPGTGQPCRLLWLSKHTGSQSVCPGCRPRKGNRQCRCWRCCFVLVSSRQLEGESAWAPGWEEVEVTPWKELSRSDIFLPCVAENSPVHTYR